MVSARAEYAGLGGGVSASTKEMVILLAVVGGLGYLAYNAIKPKAGDCWFYDLPCQAGKLGKQTEQTVYNVYSSQTQQSGGLFTGLNAWATQQRAALQGSPIVLQNVPPTPAGYNASNWTWISNDPGNLTCDASGKCTGEGPLNVGLPAGMTLQEFCAKGGASTDLCPQNTQVTKKGLLGWNFFGL